MGSKFTATPDNLKLWFTKTTDTTRDTEQAMEKLLSISEQKRLQSTGNANKRREYLLSRALMRHALSHHFLRPENEWIFIEQADSPPRIRNLPENIHISLSHSNHLICFAISGCPVGIDIEATDKQRDFPKMAKNFMDKDELGNLEQDKSTQSDLFYRIWCAKEAYYKALPTSEQSTTTLNKLRFSDLIEGNQNWLLIEGKIEQFRLAVVLKNKPEEINCNHFNPAGIVARVEWY